MKRIILILAVAISSAIFVFVLWKSQKSPKTISPVTEEKPVSVEANKQETTAQYDDQSGFSFNYPSDLKLDSIPSENENQYAHLILKSNDKKGSTEIVIEDTKESSIHDWAKKNNVVLDNAETVSFAYIKGQQLTDTNQFMTIGIDQGILFKIISQLDNESVYWKTVHGDIISTFKFKESSLETPVTNNVESQNPSQSDDVEFTEEEDLSE